MDASGSRVHDQVMARKRDRYTRARAKRTRPKTPAPTGGWSIAELAQLSGVTVRTLRDYVRRGFLRPFEFRGTSTRYPRRALLRLFALLRLRAETRANLTEIRRKLDAQSDPELEAWLRERGLSVAVLAALHADSPADSAPSLPAQPTVAVAELGETWQRIEILPGLELLLRSTASPAAKEAARRIYDEYLSAKSAG
jgi:DNA-binding transcriptional MerR regulator